jgi:hypothetical protein
MKGATMIRIDREKVRRRFSALNYPPVVIDLEVKAAGNLHEQLQGVFDAWLEGAEEEFSFKGISLSMIKDKRRCDHFNAMAAMSSLIKDPEMVEDFKSIPDLIARRRYGGPGAE